MTDKPDRVTESVVERLEQVCGLLEEPAFITVSTGFARYNAEERDLMLRAAKDALEALTTRSQPGEDAVERARDAMLKTGIRIGASEWPDEQAYAAETLARAALNAAAVSVEGVR